ncbi:hypothetical protein GNAINCEL_00015 [Serratia phage KKP 3709]|nr:hypothetical protein GNAINCEL_00015 [Serratia phage KKP 3709]
MWVDELGDAVDKTGAQVKGVISTLSKKGLIDVVEETGMDSGVQLTDEGFALFSKSLLSKRRQFDRRFGRNRRIFQR